MKRELPYLAKLGVTLFIGLVASLILSFVRDVYNAPDTQTLYRDLSDIFSVPGLLLVLFGGLVFVSNGGAFYGLSFSVLKFFNVFKKDANRNRETYRDYVARKSDKKVTGYSFLFFAGLIILTPGVVFLVLYGI